VDRVFLDANVLFSVGYLDRSRLRELWGLAGVKLVTSGFALEEARRNLLVYRSEGVPELDRLAEKVAVVPEAPEALAGSSEVDLAEKDRPILGAAVAAGCTHLLTGDKRHFGPLYGRRVQGVLVLTPAQYLRRRKRGD
jgi:predicted nucleic acid-binding protein